MVIELEFSYLAYSKILLHAMKYPHYSCSGLLLSPKSNESSANVMKVIEAIPISHASYCLSPNVEVAFNSVNLFALEQDLVISGYYQTDRYNDVGYPDIFSQRITEKICESYPNAVLCYVNFDTTQAQTFLIPHQMVDGKWRRKPLDTFEVEVDPEVIAERILFSKKRLYREVVDFDDHFDDITLDWTNAEVAQIVDRALTDVL